MDEALIALLEVKEFEFITVGEICRKAGVNRSTFYLHYDTIADLMSETARYINSEFLSYFPEEIEEFKSAMNEDFNTSKALAVLFDLATKANKAKDSNDKENAVKYISVLIKLSRVLGFDFEKVELDENQLKEKLMSVIEEFDFIENKNATAKEIMDKIIEVRNEARAQKNWAVADSIRNTLDKINIVLKDSKEGTVFELK